MSRICVENHLSKRELEELIKQEREKRLLERLVFIRDLYDGESVENAIRKLGRVKQTGYNWLKRWNAKGLQGLKPDFTKAGRPPKLSAEEKRELEGILRKRGDWTTKEVRNLILEKFGVHYSLRNVMEILRSFGEKYCKPYPRDYRRPKDAEERLEQRVREALNGGKRFLLGFLDECSPQTDSNTQRLWSFGKPEIMKNTTKYKANTFGFYAPAGESLINFMENSKKESVCKFLEEVREKNSNGSILMVLDNFTSHRAKMTQEKAGELDIRLVYLPPYSPDLNPIDQIWRGVKRRISTAFFTAKEEFLNLIEQAYNQLSGKISYAQGWIQKFLPEQSKQFHPIL